MSSTLVMQLYRLYYTCSDKVGEIAVPASIKVNPAEQECFQREVFEEAVITHAPNEDWTRCRVVDKQGRCVNIYYKPGREPIDRFTED